MSLPAAWMPPAGRHKVNVGSSLGKALKARKGASAPKRSNLPERDFYSFRYNFKPESVDSTKPGTIEIKKGKESTSVRVERPTSNDGEAIIFTGDEKPAKEWDCVLIYDEELNTFTLEKIDSCISLGYGKKGAMSARPSTSSSASPAPVPSSHLPPPRRTAADELEAQILEGLEDAEGEPDDSFGPPAPAPRPRSPLPKSRSPLARAEEEEEEEEEVPIATKTKVPLSALSRPPKPKPAPAPKAAHPSKVAPAPAPVPAAAPTKPKPRPVAKGKAKAAPPIPAPQPASTPTVNKKRPAENAFVEEIEFSRPPPPPKRARAATPPPAPAPAFSLALPTASGPDPLAHAYAAAATPQADEDEEDEEWEAVTAAPAPEPALSMHEDDGMEEIDLEELTAQIEEEVEMSAEEDEPMPLQEEPEPISLQEAPRGGGPQSLRAFAGGAEEDYDDDISSTDESDED